MRICTKCKKREGSWWNHLCKYCRNIPTSEKEVLEYEKVNNFKDIITPEQIRSSLTANEANKMADTFKHWLGIIITIVIMFAIVAAIGFSLSGPPDNSCGPGYYWVEDFRGANSGCAPD